jgi:hypothetical protein
MEAPKGPATKLTDLEIEMRAIGAELSRAREGSQKRATDLRQILDRLRAIGLQLEDSIAGEGP